MLIVICLISLLGAIVYKIYALNIAGISISLALVSLIFIILLFYLKNKEKLSLRQALWQLISFPFKINTKIKINKIQIFLTVIYILSISACFYLLVLNQTENAIISPWEVMPKYYFLLYFISLVILLIIILTRNNFILPLLTLHYFLSFGVALIVYKIGYGFDPFIHEATMNLISQKGIVEPKPFYYLGQYSLIIIIHKLFNISIAFLDKILVPFLAAIYLPSVLYRVLNKLFDNKKTIQLLIMFGPILPFSIFILTTPQNLSLLFLILIILLSLSCQSIYDLIIIYILALTTFFIHPISGIPAIFFSALLTIYHSNLGKAKALLQTIIILPFSLALPTAFYLFEKKSNLGEQINFWQNFKNLLSIPSPVMPHKGNIFLDLVYLYGFNTAFVIGLFIVGGIIIAAKYKNQCKIFIIYFYAGLSMFFSYLLTRFLPFNFLIEYERNDYANRILKITVLFLLPLIILLFYWFLSKIRKQNKIIKYSFLFFLLSFLTASLYLSYPRNDNYFNSHGYSVGKYDIEAVHWINQSARGKYIVLANQQVSAAALREFGFDHYYTCDCQEKEVFYYSIPTGGTLYQYYLKMVYEKPSQNTIKEAMNLVGAEEGYFVLNKYWWASPKIIEEAQLESKEFTQFGSGDVFVFKFTKQ